MTAFLEVFYFLEIGGPTTGSYQLTPRNKQQVVLLPKRKTSTWSAIHKLARKLEFKQSVLDQQQQE